MPSGPRTTIWDAPPHTLAKIEILRAYMQAYVPILAMSKRQRKLIIHDGFAGPNLYTNGGNGSPSAVLTACREAVAQIGDSWIADDLICVFSEFDKARFQFLQSSVNDVPKPYRLKAHTLCCSFVEAVNWIDEEYSSDLQINSPRFTFIDPFGATGAPFSVIRGLLPEYHPRY